MAIDSFLHESMHKAIILSSKAIKSVLMKITWLFTSYEVNGHRGSITSCFVAFGKHNFTCLGSYFIIRSMLRYDDLRWVNK